MRTPRYTTTTQVKSTSATTVSSIILAKCRSMVVQAMFAIASSAAGVVKFLFPLPESQTAVTLAAAANATTLKVRAWTGYTAVSGDTLVIPVFGVITASGAATASGVVTYTVPNLAKAIPAGTILWVVRNGLDSWSDSVGTTSTVRLGPQFANAGPECPVAIQATAEANKTCEMFVTVDHFND